MKFEVCINSYGKYNEGTGLGEWIELGRDWDEIVEELEAKGLNDEELFIIDDNGLGCGEANPYHINFWLEQIEEYETSMFFSCLEVMTFDEVAAMISDRTFDDIIFYEGMGLMDVAYEIADELLDSKNCPDIMMRYFDYERFARDLRLDGYTRTSYGVILIP